MLHEIISLSSRRLQVFAGFVVGLMMAGPALAATNAPAPLSLSRVMQLPLTWPDKVTTTEGFSDGQKDFAAGMELALQDVQRDGVVVQLPGGGEPMLLPANWTDLGLRAAKVQQELPEDVRNVTLNDLIKRTDLLPDFVALVSDITLGDGRVIPAGTELIPGRLQMNSGNLGVVLVEKGASFNQHGGVDRLIFNAEFTDVIARMRDQARKAPADRKLRSLARLEGKLVNTQGEALEATETNPRYYVVYYAADWCGWCKRFTPTLVKFHEEMKAKHPEVQVVYLSSDRSPEEMQKNFVNSNMTWPAVAFDRRKEVMGLLAMAGPSTPHVLVLAADGQVLHDGQPGGANGANAALMALRRELNRTKK
jgi:thiol-disulfide isomerase/thioredoxin